MKRFLYLLGLLPFFIGCAPVATEVGDFTALEHDLINKKEVIPPTYSDIRPCSDGMIPVCYKKKWGFIDINGNPLVVNGLE